MNREYYFDIDGKQVPDESAMAAYLIDQDVLAIGSATSECKKKTTGLYVLINDYFGPGSDAEEITIDEIPKLFELYKSNSFDGVCEFVAIKRGISNVHWRNSLYKKYE